MTPLRKQPPAWPGSLDDQGALAPQLNPRSPRFSPLARAGVALVSQQDAAPIAPAHRYSAADQRELARQQDFKLALSSSGQVVPSHPGVAVGEAERPWRQRAADAVGNLLDAIAVSAERAAADRERPAATAAEVTTTLTAAALDPFDEDRAVAVRWLEQKSPRTRGQLQAAANRIRAAQDGGDPEALAHAATSIRRAMCSLADVVFPPRDEPWIDSANRPRQVGADQWKNRLIAFYEDGLGRSRSGVAVPEIKLLAERLDALSARLGKGVHADSSSFEIRQVYSAAWNLVGEVARLAL